MAESQRGMKGVVRMEAGAEHGQHGWWREARRRLAALALAAGWMLAPGLAAAAPAAASDLVGRIQHYAIQGGETMLDVARAFDMGFVELMAANREVDHWLPGEGTLVSIPSRYILPDAPRQGLVVNLVEMRMFRFADDGSLAGTRPIGIGREAFRTPHGQTTVVRKQKDPTWYPTADARREDPELPAVVGPGPDNPLGHRALYLGWSAYLIHGTNKPWGVGRRVSRGCLRLYPEDVEVVYDLVPVGTPVTIVDQVAKVGWEDGELYLEVHPDREQADLIEAAEPVPVRPVEGLKEMVLKAAGAHAARLQWDRIAWAEAERPGYPIQITGEQPPPETADIGAHYH